MKYKVLIALSALALAGCTTLPREIRSDGHAHFAQATHVGPLIVRPDQLDEDNRCPQATQCITAGRLKIEISIWHGGKASASPLTLGKPLAIAGGKLVLDEVQPAARPNTRIRPVEYLFHFRWTAD